MNKLFIVTTLIVATLPVTAVAADTDTGSPLGEHPAVLVAKTWGNQGYDYASKMYPHPARLELYAEAPREMGDHPAVLVAKMRGKRDDNETSGVTSHPALAKATAVPLAARQEPQFSSER